MSHLKFSPLAAQYIDPALHETHKTCWDVIPTSPFHGYGLARSAKAHENLLTA
jgi:hypothetical protein